MKCKIQFLLLVFLSHSSHAAQWLKPTETSSDGIVEFSSYPLPDPKEDVPGAQFVLYILGASQSQEMKTVSVPLMMPAGFGVYLPLDQHVATEVDLMTNFVSTTDDVEGSMFSGSMRAGLSYKVSSSLSVGADFNMHLIGKAEEENEKHIKEKAKELSGPGIFARFNAGKGVIELYSVNLKSFGFRIGVAIDGSSSIDESNDDDYGDGD